MNSDRNLDGRPQPGASRRVLVTVHGREPAGWEAEVCRALALSPEAAVRVLAIIDVPSPPSAALLPSIGRARSGARREWRRLQEATVGQRVEALLAGLPVAPDVAWVDVADADPARAIVERAAVWGADLIVVGVDGSGWLERRLLGAIHERVVDQAACAVLVMPRPERGALCRRGGAPASPIHGPRPATAKGGA
jgi:nucleotide-binding universal stress UspA family protein